MTHYYKALIGTLAFLGLNGLGLILAVTGEGFLKYIGYADYYITSLILLLVVYQYMNSDFYKNLGKETTQ